MDRNLSAEDADDGRSSSLAMGAQRRLGAIRSHAVGRIAASCAATSHPESPRPLTEEQIKQFIATSVATSRLALLELYLPSSRLPALSLTAPCRVTTCPAEDIWSSR
jgi:hypothetical protein